MGRCPKKTAPHCHDGYSLRKYRGVTQWLGRKGVVDIACMRYRCEPTWTLEKQ
jgi:hypothetical protein